MPTSIPSGIVVIQPFGHNGHWPEIEGAVSLSNTKVASAEAYLHAK